MPLSKCLDLHSEFIGYILSTKLPFCIVFPFFSIMCSLHFMRDYDERKADET